MKTEDMFKGPIPGQSLTGEPGSKPWEKPPQMNDVDEVVEFYLGRLSEEGKMDEMLTIVEGGIPISALTKSILTSGASRGLHNVDMNIMVAPVLHRFIKNAAEDNGIEYDEGLVDKAKQRETELRKAKIKFNKELNKEVLPDLVAVEEEEPEPQGLVKRRK